MALRNWRRIGLIVLVALVVVALALTAVGWSYARRSLPQTDGELHLAGLSAPVTVLCDDRGVPSIYADNALDLMRAQGYVHAQDRFFEMDLRRHITAGRLSELVGSAGVETDKVIRTLGWRRVAEQELPLLSPKTRQYLQAYADGVNAWIHSHDSTSSMSLEYTLLSTQNPDYTVEDWTPVDSLAWLKALAWDLKGDFDGELTRAELAASMSVKQIRQIYPTYPYATNPPILSAKDWPADGSSEPGSVPNAAAASTTSSAATPTTGSSSTTQRAVVAATLNGKAQQAAYAQVRSALRAVPELVGVGDGVGSNSWVVSGSRTTTGRPLLANDPHLGVSAPGIWYQVGLHCRTVNSSCPFDVSGFSFSGMPGVVIGHNATIAWGFTNLGPDVTDFYLERVQGDTALRDGTWEKLTTRDETIKVAGEADQTITVRSTRHGPILSDVMDEVQRAGEGAPVTGGDTNATYAVALAWTALTPSKSADALFQLDLATDWDQFRAAAEGFAVPAQNLVYADTSGHIGYQAPGAVPIRASALVDDPPGYWPAPGWSSAYDWKGYVPYDQMPHTLDPPEGFIVTANQAVTQLAAPFLTTEWDYGYRAKRIHDVLAAKPKVSPADMAALQLDTTNVFAPTLVKALLAVDLSDDRFTKDGQDLLRGWDGTAPDDDSDASAAAAFYYDVWANLIRLTYDDELPAGQQADGGDQWMAAMTVMLDKDNKSAWWDNRSTPGVTEGRAEILRQAMVAARLDLTKRLGKDPADWSWGKLHTVTLEHAVFGTDDVPLAGAMHWIFNIGPAPVPGSAAVPNAMGWNASEGFTVGTGPSMRMVLDVGQWDDSRWVNQSGQSGHPFSSHYDDQFDAWRTGQTFPWPFGEKAVKAAARDTLTLTSGSS